MKIPLQNKTFPKLQKQKKNTRNLNERNECSEKISLKKLIRSEEFFEKRYALLNSLEEVMKSRFDKRLQRAQEIEKRLEGKIKIELYFKSVRDDYLNKLLMFTQGERISSDDLDKVVQSVYPDKLVKMVLDRDYNSLVATAGISEKKAIQLMNKLLSINKKELLDLRL
jgi:hypothetical protein